MKRCRTLGSYDEYMLGRLLFAYSWVCFSMVGEILTGSCGAAFVVNSDAIPCSYQFSTKCRLPAACSTIHTHLDTMRGDTRRVAVCVASAMLYASVWAAQVPLTVQTAKSATNTPTKRIAVVGTGAGGLAVLKALVQLPEDLRAGWDVVAFERRDGIGGVCTYLAGCRHGRTV